MSARRLELLVLSVSERCDQRCLHCSIWKGAPSNRGQGRGHPPLGLEARLGVVEDALASGVRQALLTGGEPLLCADLWPIAERLRAAGTRLMLATNGLLLEAHAERVARLFHEVYVSLDGATPESHDRLRGVKSFDRVGRGVAALRRLASRPLLVARATLHAANAGGLAELVSAAREMGFDHVSFLALDASSDAFGGEPVTRRSLLPTLQQVEELDAAIDRLAAAGDLAGRFVLESPAKLRRLARHLRGDYERPACDAPWWSSVVEADGSVRPCFFQPAVGHVDQGLVALRRSKAYREALGAIRAGNPICERCVCPKRGAPGRRWWS